MLKFNNPFKFNWYLEFVKNDFFNSSFTETWAIGKIGIDRFRIQEMLFINPDKKY